MSEEGNVQSEFKEACEMEEVAAREVARSFGETIRSLQILLGDMPMAADMILVADELFALQKSLRENAEAHIGLEAARNALHDKIYG